MPTQGPQKRKEEHKTRSIYIMTTTTMRHTPGSILGVGNCDARKVSQDMALKEDT